MACKCTDAQPLALLALIFTIVCLQPHPITVRIAQKFMQKFMQKKILNPFFVKIKR